MYSTKGSPPHTPPRMRALCLCLALSVLSVSPAAVAQTKPATRPSTTVDVSSSLPTADAIQGHVKRLEQAKGLDEPVRAGAMQSYKEALAQLQIAESWRRKSEAFETAAKEAPAKVVIVKKELEAAATQPAATAPATADLAELERLLGKARADLEAAKKTAADLESEPTRRSQRRVDMTKLAAAAQQKLGEVEKAVTKIPKDRHPELAGAQRALLQAQKQALRQENDAYQKELAGYDAERDLLMAQADFSAGQVSRGEKYFKALQSAVDRKRTEEAARAAREADAAAAAAARAHPALREVAEESARLANQRSSPDGAAAKIPQVTQRLEAVKATLVTLQQNFESLMEKEKAIGRTSTFGVLLRKQRAELPDVRDYQSRMKARQAEIAAVQLRLIELQERRTQLSDVGAAFQEIVAKVDATVASAQRERITAAARELLKARRKNLDELIKDYDTYFGKLVELDLQARALIAKAELISRYVGERVLWIRSAPVLGLSDLSAAGEAGEWVLGPRTWMQTGTALWADARSSPALAGAGVLAFLVLVGFRRRCVRKLALTGEGASERAADAFGPTLLAVALTAVLAATLPAIVWFLAWRLSSSPDATDATRAVSAGLSSVAAVLLTFGTLRQICRRHGLAEAHFRVPPKTIRPLRRWLLPLTIILTATTFLIYAVEWQGNETWKNALGRAALIVGLLTVAVFAQRLLRPSGGLLAGGRGGPTTSWLYRLRLLWYVLAIAGPVLLALLAVLGYYYTALHLTGGLAMTFWLVMGLTILGALVRRWLAVAFRTLAVRRSRLRRARIEAADSADADAPPASPVGSDDELGPRLDQVNRQNQRLVRTVGAIALILGAWGIWADSLPALAALKRVELWTHTAKVTAQVATPDGKTLQQAIDKVVPVTLADVGLAVLVVVLTVAAVRNIPGLLEVAVLQRIRMDSGARYATTAILRYSLGVVGVVLAFKMIGVGWSSVQWLVAAMTVGLGFGLQEIFANFVSGLIILFERPIRVGDTVTVGETAGTVTRIRIRATTITDWDRKELIVPNKEFVTGRLVNWSLSDRVLRVILRVGLAYGSDTELAERILHQKAREHALVLPDPAPVVLFSTFGDNSLNFELRVYIGGIEHYVKVWHDLNMAIDKAFRKAGITIAFPQRDMHLNTLEPLEIRVLPADEARKPPTDKARGDTD